MNSYVYLELFRSEKELWRVFTNYTKNKVICVVFKSHKIPKISLPVEREPLYLFTRNCFLIVIIRNENMILAKHITPSHIIEVYCRYSEQHHIECEWHFIQLKSHDFPIIICCFFLSFFYTAKKVCCNLS